MMRAQTEVAAGIREGYLSVEGGKIWYRLAGKGKPGIPLLTVHGGPGAAHDYLEPLEALGDERPAIFYDQLDCGNSAKPDDPELWTVARRTGFREPRRFAAIVTEAFCREAREPA